MGQSHSGSTVNANVTQNAQGEYVFTFDDPFDMLINLTNSANVIADGSQNNDRYNLQNSSGLIINGSGGNDIFAIAATQTGLNGNTIHGQASDNFVTIAGSGTNVDLTGSSGVAAVVGYKTLSGESVDLNFSQISSSMLVGAGTNRAFAAVIGQDGMINLSVADNVQFIGSVNAAGAGFDAAGNAVTGSALSALQAEITSDSAITGNLATLYGDTISAKEAEVKDLNAYVFSDGSTDYTVWTDGTITTINVASGATNPIYNPGQASSSAFTFDSVSVFSKAGSWGSSNLYTDLQGNPDILLLKGSTLGSSAILLTHGVTGASVHGINGDTGNNYFGLGQSGGDNHIYTPQNGAVIDLQNSTSLSDILSGSSGFDVVQIRAAASTVDLTAGNLATGTASTGIDAVVGSHLASSQTVDLDVSGLTKHAGSVPTAMFEALLGASGTLQLSDNSSANWVEISTFAPGSTPPANALALSNGAELDTLYGSNTYTAENALTGYLFERVNSAGHVFEYLTIYTDAALSGTSDFHFLGNVSVVDSLFH